MVQVPNWPNLVIKWVAFIKVSSFIPLPIAWITTLATVPWFDYPCLVSSFEAKTTCVTEVEKC